jgi:serine protease Do
MHTIAGKAVAFKEALSAEFKVYQEQVIKNAKVLAEELVNRGYKLLTGGTDNHLMLLDLRDSGITGKELEIRLDEVHITANKNSVPNDPQKPTVTSGLRIGTPAVTSRGFKEAEMVKIAGFIADVINDYSENSSVEVFLMSDPQNPVEAKIIGYNISADLAVVKIEKTKLPAIELADSSTIKVGQYAVAIGCPGGIEFLNSVSYGTISGLNRTITIDAIGEMDLIQTDAAINPGNSGGALLNSKGQLIGINSSKLVDESFEGMGFAIPTNTVKEVVDEIIENKNPSPYIGIEIYKFTSDYLEKYNLPAGAAVKNVVPNGPADKAGIENGHIITKFNGVEIKEYTDFIDALEKCKPGDKVTVRMYKEHRYETTTVTIGSNNSYG